jgi:hypothetical protein
MALIDPFRVCSTLRDQLRHGEEQHQRAQDRPLRQVAARVRVSRGRRPVRCCSRSSGVAVEVDVQPVGQRLQAVFQRTKPRAASARARAAFRCRVPSGIRKTRFRCNAVGFRQRQHFTQVLGPLNHKLEPGARIGGPGGKPLRDSRPDPPDCRCAQLGADVVLARPAGRARDAGRPCRWSRSRCCHARQQRRHAAPAPRPAAAVRRR